MLFKLLKYLQPTHYFTIPKNNGERVFPDVSKLPPFVFGFIDFDKDYKSEVAKIYDASWQAIQKGYIGSVETIRVIEKLPLIDEYRFLRKYFHKVWVFYVLVLRVVTFHNPLKEFSSWFKTRGAKRYFIHKSPFIYEDFEFFESELVRQYPKVSVIIPTLNRYIYLKDVLKDLEQQTYKNFEVIIVDQSDPFRAAFYDDFKLDLKVFKQTKKALWQARNTAIRKSTGNYLLFFDDDSRVDSQWVGNHLKCLDFFNADASSGVSISKIGADVPAHYAFFKVSDQLDTGNVLIKKNVFKKIGLFDRQFEKQRMGDGEFGLRLYLNGYLNVSNPYAKRLHLKVGTGGLREMGSWDAFRTKKWFTPRPIPSVLYFFRRYFGKKQAILALLRTVPLSIMPYRFKKHRGMLVLGVFFTFLLIPLVLLQVLKSWRLSSEKLGQGPLIDILE